MPEGPEIWVLSKSINALFKDDNMTQSYGKHLFVIHKKKRENWSFGMSGRVQIYEKDGQYEIEKLNSGWLPGDTKPFHHYEDEIKHLGIDWMSGAKTELQKEVDSWTHSKKKLAGLLLDQSKISGIGVAWGSEILHHAGLRPDLKTCDQDLSGLVDSMIHIREKVKKEYSKQFNLSIKNDELVSFINKWFDNLYAIRTMEVYKKGSKKEVLGRTWWLS